MNVNLDDCGLNSIFEQRDALTCLDITNGDECFELNLTRPSKDAAPEPIFSESFNPAWTYAFFGEEQEIIGYKDPSIQLSFRANDMKPSLQAGFEEKVELPEHVYSEKHLKVDLETVFKEYLPACMFPQWAAAIHVHADKQ